ncbi:disulfide-isomerase [Hyphodiscus hymeniophilus]|uniref:protein disulfide-isomerase n=1 Tax=Hyphodiscus hymeniophilus TaxID=353542 RepID=A0A9P6VR58_9HELO|nr:disulfide-isomerase [Hyphodiscus hymeniophilus]
MVHPTAITVAAAALLAALPVNAGLYSKNSPVVQIDARNYDRLIAQSNYTTILEFYAPWCGHCKNLQPAFEKAANSLSGLAKVAAVDCDEDSNKPFCGGFGVQGFPTLKIVKPGSKKGKPIIEDYQGPRTAKGIVEAVTDKIPNLVKRVSDKTLEEFLAGANDTAKAILFSEQGKTSSLFKAVAIEFKGSISMAQIRNTEKASIALFGIEKFPTLVLLPGGPEAEGIVFKDPFFNKETMVKFLSQAAEPNPDPAPAKVKVQKAKDSEKKKEEFESASSKQAKAEASTAGASATDEVLEEEPTESPLPIVDAEKPIVLPDPAPPLSVLDEDELIAQCMGPRTGTCILALLPDSPNEVAAAAVGSLSEVAHRHHTHKRSQFPFYILPQKNVGFEKFKSELGLPIGEIEVIAINAKRGWWRALPKDGTSVQETDVSEEAIERWVDSIRLGEGAKQKLPEGFVPEEPVVEEVEAEPIVTEEGTIVEPVEEGKIEIEETVENVHDEL